MTRRSERAKPSESLAQAEAIFRKQEFPDGTNRITIGLGFLVLKRIKNKRFQYEHTFPSNCKMCLKQSLYAISSPVTVARYKFS